MFAIVDINGKQYKVQKGDKLELEKFPDHKEGDKVKIEKVLLMSDEGKLSVGLPYIPGVAVELLLKGNMKGDKIRVFKKKPKKRYERTIGHRQTYTMAEVLAIG